MRRALAALLLLAALTGCNVLTPTDCAYVIEDGPNPTEYAMKQDLFGNCQ